MPPSENGPALSPEDRLAELLARDGIGDALAFARSFPDKREYSHLWCMIGDHASEKLMFQIAEYAYTRAFGPRMRMNLTF
ncbi:MAG: hypothetical protein U9R40_02050 [Synergistota bacterium]|nr:hypothetical protein [Synergistota bacterium]